MKYLLDTSVIAAAIRGRLPVVLRLANLKPGDVAVSSVSRMEAESALRAPARSRQARLLRELFGAVRTLEFGVREAQVAAGLASGLSGFDRMLAGTALANQLVLVTEQPGRYASVSQLDVERWT